MKNFLYIQLRRISLIRTVRGFVSMRFQQATHNSLYIVTYSSVQVLAVAVESWCGKGCINNNAVTPLPLPVISLFAQRRTVVDDESNISLCKAVILVLNKSRLPFVKGMQ